MNIIGICCLLSLLCAAGCTTKAKARDEARKAYIAGEKQGELKKAQETSVWIVGNVKTPLIPWAADLTLAKALVAAEYQGPGDPRQITILRRGQKPIHFDPKWLLSGRDMPLVAGDKVELRW